MDSSAIDLIYADIPFYRLLVSGTAEFAGIPMNLEQDVKYVVMKVLETRAAR